MKSMLSSSIIVKRRLIIGLKRTVIMVMGTPFTIINNSIVSEIFQIIDGKLAENPKTIKIASEKRIV